MSTQVQVHGTHHGGAPRPIHKDQPIKAKYIGTGDVDMTKYEWVTKMHRDTMASHVGHYDQMSYYATICPLGGWPLQ